MRRFRRRMGGMRRRFGKPFAKQTYTWVAGIHDETALDASGATVTEAVLMAATDVMPDNIGNQRVQVKRVIINGIVQFGPDISGTSQNGIGVFWQVDVLDTDDTDSEINTLINNNRVIATGVAGGVVRQGVPGAADFWPGIAVQVDWKGNIFMGRDDLLVLRFEFISDATTGLSTASYTGFERVLAVVP